MVYYDGTASGGPVCEGNGIGFQALFMKTVMILIWNLHENPVMIKRINIVQNALKSMMMIRTIKFV